MDDDYDSEFRYAAAPVPALQGLDGRGCVAYVGSCSSVLYPPLRVGWVVAPPALMAPLVAAKWLANGRPRPSTSRCSRTSSPGAASRGTCADRPRSTARAAVARHRPADGRPGVDSAGLQAPLSLPVGTDEAAVVTASAARDVGVYPLRECYAGAECENSRQDQREHPLGLLLGFAATDEAAIDEGVRRLAPAVLSR